MGHERVYTVAIKLYVGGLSFSTTSDRLRDHFAQCGAVQSAEVVVDRYSNQSRGFGFVEMADEAGAKAAIERLNGQTLDDRPLRVDVAKSREDRPSPRRGPRY